MVVTLTNCLKLHFANVFQVSKLFILLKKKRFEATETNSLIGIYKPTCHVFQIFRSSEKMSAVKV